MSSRTLLQASLLLLPLVVYPTPTAQAFHEDCDTYAGASASWSDATGIDYQDSWENQFGQAPESFIAVGLTITCTIRGHSIPNGELCPASGCVKFWGQMELISGSPGTVTAAFCSDLIINGASTVKRETPLANGHGRLCEYYCPNYFTQCAVGKRVTVTLGARLHYRWEADDTLGSERQSTYNAYNRAGNVYPHTHTTCQAGNPALQLVGGSCGIL